MENKLYGEEIMCFNNGACKIMLLKHESGQYYVCSTLTMKAIVCAGIDHAQLIFEWCRKGLEWPTA